MSERGPYAKGAAKRRAILQGALQVLAVDGYRNTSIRAIGRAMAIAPAHILYYFPTREDLLQEVILEWNDRVLREMPDDADFFQTWITINEANTRIPGIIALYTAFAAEAADPAHPSHEFFRRRFDSTRRLIAEQVRVRQATGEFDADLVPEAVAMALVALSDGLQLQWLIDRRIDMAAGLRTAVASLARPTPP